VITPVKSMLMYARLGEQVTCVVQVRSSSGKPSTHGPGLIVTFEMEVVFCAEAIDGDVEAQTSVAAAAVRLSSMHTQPTHPRTR
jgi:hypothetical protein